MSSSEITIDGLSTLTDDEARATNGGCMPLAAVAVTGFLLTAE